MEFPAETLMCRIADPAVSTGTEGKINIRDRIQETDNFLKTLNFNTTEVPIR